MATTDQELRTLNKTVGDAVNILKLYVGSTGQLKAKNDTEQKIIDGWLNVVDEAQEAEKRKRAFAERERDQYGRFIKKREGTWGKFLDMAEGTFKFLDKVTLGITGKIKGMVSSVLTHVSGFFSELKGHFLSLFGEESEWFGMLAAIKDAVSGFATTIIGWIWKKTPNWAKKMIKSLENMYNLQVKQMKLGFLEAGGDTKKKGISVMGMVSALVFTIGAAIGTFMHRYFVLITKIPMFGKVISFFTKLESVPFLGKLLKSIRFGFKFLGWPLTILLSVIDFIKGYKETEGGLWEKVKGGLWSALEGFIELPVRFMGWIVEKTAGFFGVKLANVADNIMNTIKKGFDFLIEFSPLKAIFKFFEVFFGTEGSFIEKFKKGAMVLLNGISGFFKKLWNNIIDWMVTKIPSWLPKGDSISKTLTGMKIEDDALKTSFLRKHPINETRQLDNAKIEKGKQNNTRVLDMMRNLWDATKEGVINTGKAITNLATVQNNNGGGSTGDVKQIPDELDNALIGINNHNGAMD